MGTILWSVARTILGTKAQSLKIIYFFYQESSRYAVGIFNGSELHLTPLNGIVSLKPSLQYLDKSDRTAKSEGRSKLNESSQDEDEDEETAKANAIQKVICK